MGERTWTELRREGGLVGEESVGEGGETAGGLIESEACRGVIIAA